MKTIAVLTDFSDRSEHAARYAMHLAHKIKADILLFNAFLVPADVPAYASQIAWPLETFDDIKADSENNLINLSNKLEYELKDKLFPGSYIPAITIQCEEGPVASVMSKLEDNKNIVLMVLAAHGNDNVADFLMGDNCRRIIDNASLPMLVVPEFAPIKNICKFAFATDITFNDVDYIRSIASLAKQFSGEILVTNVNPDVPLDNEHEAAVNLFMSNVEHHIDYPRIQYQSVPSDNVKKGLEYLIDNFKFDVLVMVHRKSHFFSHLFKPSLTKKMAGYSHKPLLVYPFPVPSIPVF